MKKPAQAYMAQDPRTLLYYRFSEDGMQVIADVPEDQFAEKGSLFKADHLIHLPADTILTESNPQTNCQVAARKGWKRALTYTAKLKARRNAKKTIQKRKLKKLKKPTRKKLTAAEKAERRKLKLSQMRRL